MARKFMLQLVVVFINDAVLQGCHLCLFSCRHPSLPYVWVLVFPHGFPLVYPSPFCLCGGVPQVRTHVPLALVGGWVVCLRWGCTSAGRHTPWTG